MKALVFVALAACWTQPPAPAAPPVAAPDPRIHDLERRIHALEAQQQVLVDSVKAATYYDRIMKTALDAP